jgi:hypothetical protein
VTSSAFLCQQLLQSKVATCTMTLNIETLLIVPSQVDFVGRKRKLYLRKQAFWRNWQGKLLAVLVLATICVHFDKS